ncbi:g10557 [Coccomyxa elongata]
MDCEEGEMLVQEPSLKRQYQLQCEPILEPIRVLVASAKVPDVGPDPIQEYVSKITALPATTLPALSADNPFAKAAACPAKKDQPIYNKPVQQIRDTLQVERAREDSSLGKDSVAKQQVQHAFRNDSAMFDVTREHLAKEASILQTGAPILNQLKPMTTATAQPVPQELPSTAAAVPQTPQAKIRHVQVRSIRTVEKDVKETEPAAPRAAPVKRQSPDEVNICLKVPAAPVNAASLEPTTPITPTTPPQGAEPLPTRIKPDRTVKSFAGVPMKAATCVVPPVATSRRVPYLVELLQSGAPADKTGAAWALHDLAKGTPQNSTGDLVWESGGVVPLVAMLAPADSPQAIAAAAAIGQLATPTSKAFQIGVGAAGGLGKLLVMAQCDNPEPATAAAKALAGLVACNPMLQEALLDGKGASILVKLLDASPYTVTGAGQGDDGQGKDTESHKTVDMQAVKYSLDAHNIWKKQAAAATALGNLAQGYSLGQEEVAKLGAIPKMLALLKSTSETVKERAAQALLAIVDKDGANQQLLREAGGVPSLMAVIERSARITGHSRGAEHAAALLCRLTLYKSAHAELQESGCIGALVPFLKGDNDVIKAHATWAIHNLTAGGPETEDSICKAGGVPALMSLIRSCAEAPDQAALLQPATIALCNLAAGDNARRNAIVDAGALPVLVKLLSHQVLVAGHAARTLWNLASRHVANQDAIREARAIPPLVHLLKTAASNKGAKTEAPAGAQEEAAGALGALARGHTANQDAVLAAGAITPLLTLVSTGTPAVRAQAAWTLQALTEGNAACQAALTQAGGVGMLIGQLRFPEEWNWTPVVGTLKNLGQGERPSRQALLAEGAVPVLVDVLTSGRPILKVGAADTLGSLARTKREARTAIREAGGVKKLKELCSAASVEPTPVKQAARKCLFDMGTTQKDDNKKNPMLLRIAEKMLNFKLRLLGLPKI